MYLFLLFPIFLVVYATHRLTRNHEVKMFLWIAAALAYFYAVLPPTMDAYRLFHVFQESEWNDLFQSYMSSHTDKDFLFPLLSIVFKSVGLDFFCLRFLLLFSCFLILYGILRDILKKNELLSSSHTLTNCSILLLFFSVKCLQNVYGIRFATGEFFVLAGCYCICERKYLTGCAALAFAISMHFSLYVYVGILLLSFLLGKIRLTRTVKIVLPVICLLLSHNLTLLQDVPLLSNFVFMVEGYLSGYWYETEVSMGTVIFNFFKAMPFFVLYFIFIVTPDRKDVWTRCVFLVSLLVFLVFNYWSIRLRFVEVATLFLLINYLLTVENLAFWKKAFPCILIAFFCIQSCFFYAFRREIFYARNLVYWTSPAFFAVEPIYDEEWIGEKLDSKGEWIGDEVSQ